MCFILIFGCNSVMWTTFTKALNAAPSSVQVSIVNGAVNFGSSVRKKAKHTSPCFSLEKIGYYGIPDI